MFATSVVDVTLINGTSIAVTLGADRRNTHFRAGRPGRGSHLRLNSRVVLPVEATQVFAHLLSRMLRRAEELKAEMRAGEAREVRQRPRGKVS